jgi:indole-3-glycerol phosphate synthase
MTILDQIIQDKYREVESRKQFVSVNDLMSSPYFKRPCLSLKSSLLNSSSGIISEFKRKSPSKGWIHEDADVVEITSAYYESGASGISILTDSPYFGGVSEDLTAARPHVGCPVLRKDFMVDEYQLYEAKSMGADVILLIAAALTVEKTAFLAEKAHALGLEVLLEVHNREEICHANHYVDIIGVNNRNLKTFEVDVQLSARLSEFIPDEFVKISESGISSPETVLELRQYGFRGFLMGENFMKENNPAQALKQFIAKIQ